MNPALVYLIRTRLKNQLKNLVRSPAKLVYTVILIALLAFVLFAGNIEEPGMELRDVRELTAGVTALYVIMFFLTANSGFSSGASIFKMPDVNFLFAGPFRPVQVLFCGLLQQMGASLLLGFFLLFQYSWVHSLYGVGIGGLLVIVVGYGLAVFSGQLTGMLLYCLLAVRPGARKAARGIFIVIPAAYALWIFLTALGHQDALAETLAALGNSLAVRLFPIVGWLGGAVGGAILGHAGWVVLGFVLWCAVLAAAGIFLHAKDIDYYEDVLQSTETAYATQEAAKEGKLTESAPKKLRLGKTGLGKGEGASVFYYKHKLENRRSRTFLLSGQALIFVVVIIGFTFFVRDGGLMPVLLFATYMQFFSVAMGRIIRELLKPYVYLVPESPFRKLLWCLGESLESFIVEAILVAVPVCLLLGLGVAEMAAFALVRVSFSLLFLGGNLAEDRIFGGITSKVLTMTFYIILLLILSAPGVILAVVLSINGIMWVSVEVTMCLAMAVCNLPLAALTLFLCRGVLGNAELNQ